MAARSRMVSTTARSRARRRASSAGAVRQGEAAEERGGPSRQVAWRRGRGGADGAGAAGRAAAGAASGAERVLVVVVVLAAVRCVLVVPTVPPFAGTPGGW